MKIRAWFQKAAAKFAAKTLNDLRYGLAILPRMKALCIAIVILMMLDLFLIFGNPDILYHFEIDGMREIIWNVLVYVGVAFAITVILIIILETWKQRTHGSETLGEDTARFSVFYTLHNMTDRLVDVLMVWLSYKYGSLLVLMAVIQPVSILLCILVIQAHDRISKEEGYDLLGISRLRKIQRNMNGSSSPFGDKILQAGKLAIFLVGSLIVLDSDVVTLILRKRERLDKSALLLLIASSGYSIVVWSAIYLFGTQRIVSTALIVWNFIAGCGGGFNF